jgi:hypothetical protein
MDEPVSVISELQPWPIRTTRGAVQGVRKVWLVVTNALWGWGIGGAFVILSVVVLLAVFVLGPVISQHSEAPPCQQATGIVEQITKVQDREHGKPLDAKAVRHLHRLGSGLTPIADHAYGSAKDPLKNLAALVSNVQVGDRLQAGKMLDQISMACPGF